MGRPVCIFMVSGHDQDKYMFCAMEHPACAFIIPACKKTRLLWQPYDHRFRFFRVLSFPDDRTGREFCTAAFANRACLYVIQTVRDVWQAVLCVISRMCRLPSLKNIILGSGERPETRAWLFILPNFSETAR